MEVGVAGSSREVEKRSAVDPHDEPSAEWGWHGSYPKGKIIAGVISIILLVVFLFGPYQSHTQVLWLGGIALLLVFMIWRQVVAQRNAWRR
jgi:hypothetical protein